MKIICLTIDKSAVDYFRLRSLTVDTYMLHFLLTDVALYNIHSMKLRRNGPMVALTAALSIKVD